MTALWVALAGGAGAVVRFALNAVVRGRTSGDFPWATVLINITGSLLLGVLTGLVMFHGQPTALRTAAGTGFCGGYTTFSTASFETVRLVQQQRYWQGAANAIMTLLLTVAAGGLGLLLTSG